MFVHGVKVKASIYNCWVLCHDSNLQENLQDVLYEFCYPLRTVFFNPIQRVLLQTKISQSSSLLILNQCCSESRRVFASASGL